MTYTVSTATTAWTGRSVVLGSTFTLSPPKASPWVCELWGGTRMVYRPPLGQHPNWFWRKMHYLAFGNRWVYRPE